MNAELAKLLSEFEPITLEKMGKVKLMNRIDTKFVTNDTKLYRNFMVMTTLFSYNTPVIDDRDNFGLRTSVRLIR